MEPGVTNVQARLIAVLTQNLAIINACHGRAKRDGAA
jgi:hypothetical protein